MQPLADLQLLVLLAAANGTPVFAKKLLGERFAWPLDGGLRFVDGQPLVGRSKTLRGVVLAVAVAAAIAPPIGLDWSTGAIVGALAMAGDLFSSFVKRRLRLVPSSMALGLDQVPESLFPLLACRISLSLTWADIVACVAVFLFGELAISRLLYRLGIRDRPY
ncbi:MAG: CDP-archaeol synthase [Alphaproteobacteria bacterium]|nr:CDP-archaeol synthase [Alphaproteobacteria bacterium]